MNTKKYVLGALLGFGLAMPVVGTSTVPVAAAEEGVSGEALSAQPMARRQRHNRKWREAKFRARNVARRGGSARDVVREFRREMRSPDIVVNVCVINVINAAENVVAIGGSVNQVINLINSANCEFR